MKRKTKGFAAYDFHSVDSDDTLGVALIQPLGVGIEYMQFERALFPTRRSLVVNIDPVSTMLSFEDLQLVEVVLKRWSSGRNKRPPHHNNHSCVLPKSGKFPQGEKSAEETTTMQFEVVFNTTLLGLGLVRTDGSQVAVNSIQNPEYTHQVNVGDVLISVGDENVRGKSLDQIVAILVP